MHKLAKHTLKHTHTHTQTDTQHTHNTHTAYTQHTHNIYTTPPAQPPSYLLDVLLEDAELQPLVEPHLAVLPDALEPPLVVQHLMHHVQHLVHCLGVVGCEIGRASCRERVSSPV